MSSEMVKKQVAERRKEGRKGHGQSLSQILNNMSQKNEL